MIRGLYGMVDLPPAATVEDADRLARALLDAGARVLQLRHKQGSARSLLDVGLRLRALTRGRDAWLVVNDRLDVAQEVGADGVHLGQEDLPIAAARQLAPAPFVIGVSTHTLAQARAAADAGADYLGFGPCFATRSKENPWPVVGLAALAEVCRAVPIPVVAIGGITAATIADVARAGAAAAAVIGAIRDAADPCAAAVELAARFYQP